MEQLYHNNEYHHQNHHDGGHQDHHHGHHDGGHHGHHGGGDHNGFDQGHDPGSGQAQGNSYNNGPNGGQGQGLSGAEQNQYNNSGFQGHGQGQGVGDTGHFDYGGGQGQGQAVGVDQGHNLLDGYGSGGHETGYGGNDFGGCGQGQAVDPSSGFGGSGTATGTGVGGGNVGISGAGSGVGGGGGGGISGGVGVGGGGGIGTQPISSIPSAYPYTTGVVPPPVPFISNRNPSNRISVNPSNTSAQTEYALLDLTSIPAPQGSSTTSYRPLDRFSSNTSRSTHQSGGNSPIPPPVPPHPGSSIITHSTWDNSTQDYRPDRPLSQASLASTTLGPYQSIGSPIMYQDFIPPPPGAKSPQFGNATNVLPVTTASTGGANVRRSVGAPQDRGPEMLASPITSGHPSDLNAFERRAPQAHQENAYNPDSLFNVVSTTLRQPQGEGGP
ncbi:hypothetical protein BGW39_003933 [Mortierella sp. 14UC]|nr:hypothetical protein BGW39_003933 [Mortierella sp. 14UC]